MKLKHRFLLLNILLLVIMHPIFAQPTEGLISYYPLNGNAQDSSGNENHGVSIGGVVPENNRFENINSALHFDGLTGKIRVPYSTQFQADNISVSAWVKVDQFTNSGQTFVTRWHNSSANQFVFALEIFCLLDDWQPPFIYPNFAIAFDNMNIVRCRSLTPIELGVWTHLCGMFDGNIVKLYVNGVLVRSMPAAGMLQRGVSPLMIGAHDHPQVSLQNLTYGTVDEVRLYNRALSEGEVWELHSNLMLTHPNGSEIVRAGFSDTIRWNYFEVNGNVHIELNRSFPSGAWETLFDSVANHGFVPWLVSGQTTNSARIRITSLNDSNMYDVSDANFTIQAADPSPPGNLTITTIGENARLNWDRVDTNIYGQPITISRYLVFFRNQGEIPWQFLGVTVSEEYTHPFVVTYSPAMYYEARAWIGDGDALDRYLEQRRGQVVTEDELLQTFSKGFSPPVIGTVSKQ